MGNANGMLIQARQNPLIYTLILLIIGIVVFFLILHFSLMYLEKLHSSPEWIEAHKKLPTKRINVKKIALELGLSLQEQKVLLDVCRQFEIPNIEFVIRNLETLDLHFSRVYNELKDDPKKESLISTLFTIRFKIEKERNKTFLITNTKLLKPNQELFYFDSNQKYVFKVDSNEKNGLYLSMPKGMENSPAKPNPLNKIKLTFNGKNSVSYGFITRLVRYEKQADESELMFITHTSNLKPVQRRMTKRVQVNSPCNFQAALKTTDKSGTPHFTEKEHSYKGIIGDISASGCKLLCKIPIKIGQYIGIDYNIHGKVSGHASGTIVMTNKSQEGEGIYILHIKFLEITEKERNQINAFAYKYLK